MTIVSVGYYDQDIDGYVGEYIYYASIPLVSFQKVIAPTAYGDRKAIVINTDLPESVIKDEWRNNMKVIKELDV